MNQQQFAQTTHCPKCNRCFCSVTKMQAIDGLAICPHCKPEYENQLRINNQVPHPSHIYPQ